VTIDSGSEPEGQRPRTLHYRGGWLIALSAALGIAAGVGAFTFRYAKGLSYFSREPAACANCHIMQSQYDSWQKSSHHAAAVCIDCHLPHGFVAKYLAKAENGYRHSKEFTAQTFHEPIRVKPRGMAILQENCVTCHELLTHEIASGPRGERDALTCVHCHAGVGHGERTGLGGPLPPIQAKTSPSSQRD
jgi:cytochrome c nitrite reductase small subunit